MTSPASVSANLAFGGRERATWTLTPAQSAFVDEARDWIRAELARPYLADLPRRSAMDFFGIEPEFSRRLGEAGYIGVTTPREQGGPARSHVEQAALQAELAASRAPILGHFVAEREVLPALLRFGTDEHRRRYVGDLLGGRMLCAQCFTEPGAGSDLAAVRLAARIVDGGFVLSGVKWLNSVAHVASHLWVIARTDPGARHRGLSMFLIPAAAPGVRIEPLAEMTGARRLNCIHFEDVEVDAGCLVGELNGGWTVAMDAVSRERAGAARPAGMRRTLRELANHVPVGTDRRLADDPETAPALAELAARIEACDALWQRYAWEMDRGTAVPELAGTTLKVYGDELEQQLGDLGTTLLGRGGVLDIDDAAPLAGRLGRLHLAAPGFSIGGGASEVLRTVIATRGLGLPR